MGGADKPYRIVKCGQAVRQRLKIQKELLYTVGRSGCDKQHGCGRVCDDLRESNEKLECALEEIRAIEEEVREQYQELQKKEEKLRESETRFRTVLENIDLISVILDRQGGIAFCNNYLLKLTGRQKEEIAGQNFFSAFVPAETRDELERIFLEAVSAGNVVSRMVYDIETIDRERRLISWSSTILSDPGTGLAGVAFIGEDITDRKPAEELYKILSNSAPVGIYIIQDGKFQYINPRIQELTGYSPSEFIDKNYFEIVLPADRDAVRKNALATLKGERSSPYEYRYIMKNGEIRWVMETVTPVQYRGKQAVLGYYIDITDRKQAEDALQESENKYRTIFENTGAATIIIEEDTIISLANAECEKLFGYAREEIEGKKSWTEFVVQEDLEKMREYHYLRRTAPGTVPRKYEFRFKNRNGGIKHIFLTIAEIPGTKKSVASLLDITDRKKAEERLLYLSFHDSLTGLYNRVYFEQEMQRLSEGRPSPAGIIICDVDGLKLVNDTFGHEAGDRLLVSAAELIRGCFRKEDMVARIGGDEFAALLSGSDRTVVENAYHRIQQAIDCYKTENLGFPLSISVGFAAGNEGSENISDLFREADNNMYREKLHRSQSARSAIVQTMMKALEARDFFTEGHADRLQGLVAAMGRAMGLTDRAIADLRLLAQFHDIGKVGIPDRILFKPGPLSYEEFVEMQRHCEIGYSISLSAPDLAPIADLILKHHEWWNGQGYPLGLMGEEIPLECRILAIADAYDAMTNDRPYRKALTHSEAVAELRRCCGDQFDPQLLERFIIVLNKQKF